MTFVKVDKWNFRCVREIEAAKREEVERIEAANREEREQIGAWPQYDKNMKSLTDMIGRVVRSNNEYIERHEPTPADIAFDKEIDRLCEETVLRSHRHSLIVVILIFGCTHEHPFAMYRNGDERLVCAALSHIMLLLKRSLGTSL